MNSGPFEVTTDQITGLSTRFTEFVNRLLQVEVSAQGFDPTKLSITSN